MRTVCIQTKGVLQHFWYAPITLPVNDLLEIQVFIIEKYITFMICLYILSWLMSTYRVLKYFIQM